MSVRLLGLALLSLFLAAAAAFAQPSPRPRVREAAARGQVKDDPVVNPSASTHPLPPPARPDGERVDPDEKRNEGWTAARWTTSTLQLPGNAKKTISVTGPSVVLVRASWPDHSDVTVSVRRGSTTLKSVKGTKTLGIGRIATAQVKVPSAGNIVIGATAPGSSTAKVTLYVGVMAAQ